jgi:tRNA pseudouridine13 synthase
MDTDTSTPRAGTCAGTALLRAEPADFRVDERIEMAPEPAAEHLWLRVRKTGENTDYVARLLARLAGVDGRAMGFAGRKDRHAVTTQWFSIQLPGKPDPDFSALPPSVEVLETVRRQRKLQTGGLRGNDFVLRLREFAGDARLLDSRLEELRRDGVPNYFGVQRFGREAGNIERARAWFSGALRVCDRSERGILLSSARSAVFNAVLARRVAEGNWTRLLPGEAVQLDGSGSWFLDDGSDATLPERLAAGDIHPSGPLWGSGELASRGEARLLETDVSALHADLVAGREANGLRQERRPLRLLPRNLAWEWLDDTSIELRFGLPAGCYATTLLAEVLDAREPERGAPG